MSYLDRALRYARRVTARDEVAGELERLMCQRFLDDIERAKADDWPYWLDESRGARACAFLELLPHIKGSWAKPTLVGGRHTYPKLKLEDWQVFVTVNLFGWLHKGTGVRARDAIGPILDDEGRPVVVPPRRRFRRAYEEVARKNAKSTWAAGVLLLLFAADGEPGAMCYSAATTGEQAREVFDVARNMALRESSFVREFGVDVGAHDLSIPETASLLKPLNAEGSTLDGLNIHSAVVDELHAHKTRVLFDVLDSATGAREQPLLVMITTAGSDRSGICYEQRTYSVKVLQRVFVDETWFAAIYTLDDGDVWWDPVNWRKANPNYGVSVLVDDMQAACQKALATPSAQGNFLTKRLNMWVNADSAWMDMPAWDRAADPAITFEACRHLPCVIGLDLASKVDVLAKVYLFRDDANARYCLVPRFWLPQRAIEQGSNSQYDGWARSGHLQVHDGDVIDLDLFEESIAGTEDGDGVRRGGDLQQLSSLLEIAFDPFQATQLAQRLQKLGAPMVELRQTVQQMSEPMKELEACVLRRNSAPATSGNEAGDEAGGQAAPAERGAPAAPAASTSNYRLQHDGNPVMTWMVSNVVCHRDVKDNIYPRKERPENKIDGVVGAIVALNRLMLAPPPKRSWWEEEQHEEGAEA